MKHSIRYRLSAIFTLLLVGTFTIALMANSLFFEGFYLNNRRQMLEDNYTSIRASIEEGSNESDILATFEQLMNNTGISVILLNSSGDVKVASTTNMKPLRDLFFRIILPPDFNSTVIAEKDQYYIRRVSDLSNGTEYMVLLGNVTGNDFLMLRVTIESIRENVALANQFLIYMVIFATLVGIIVVFFISKRITNPILELAAISAKMSELDFDTKYTPGGRGEIDVLGNNMNAMSRALEETISELKTSNISLENEVKQRVEIDEMRREFLANVSHELKTPIALVQGYAEGLRDGIADDPESRAEYCDIIIDEAVRMNHMVRQLLNLNKIESGKEDLIMERFDVTEIIKSKIAAFDVKAKDMNIQISMEGPSPCMVWSDAYRVEEVINNYLSNAYDHVEGEGRILVSIARSETKTRISVFNSGEPIPEEELEKLWIKLYKIDKARTREFGGHGLGLSIVKAIMEALNNDFGVENCDNGVNFWFEIDNG